MLKAIGVIINLGVAIYLGFHLSQCMGAEEMANLNAAQNPLILSFVAVVSLFIALNN